MSNKTRCVLAIIPARGGSKRLPKKNVLSLAGKPLIAWTIEAAITSNIFDKVIVNTDDLDIAEIANSFGAEVPFIRPEELASDTASSIDVISHTLEWYSKRDIEFSDVVLLQATSPLRGRKEIIEAWKIYVESKAESVTSVCEVEHPIQWTYELQENLRMNKLFDDSDKRSQEYGKNYRLNGAIYITSVNYCMGNNSLISKNNGVAYIMSSESSVDIDNKFDFNLVNYILEGNAK